MSNSGAQAEPVRVCSDVDLPEGERAEADARAVALRADNHEVRIRDYAGAVEMAVLQRQMWDTGRTLTVSFLDGHPEVQDKVLDVARQWSEHANIGFRRVEGNTADIRVSFAEQGSSWSHVGTRALSVPSDRPTMNFGWLDRDSSDTEYERVVLHEFGHALGCIHEHQSPSAGVIPWDKIKVYEHYRRTNGWPTSRVDHNVFQRYDRTLVNASEFDRESIMLYAIPDELTVGTWSTPWNSRLSPRDKAFIGLRYPRNTTEPAPILVDAAPVQASLDRPGETDVYHFDVARSDLHIVTTTGKTDTVLSVHGPDDETVLVAADHDRGVGANARVVRKLRPGRYWVRVRHQTAGGGGSYAVEVRTRARPQG